MRVTYRRSKSRVVLAALLAASVTLITIGYRSGSTGPLHKVQQAALTLISPLQKGVTRVLSPVGGFFDAIGRLPSAESQNTKLRKEVASLKHQLNQYPAIQQQLKDALGLLQEQTWISGPTLGAEVIAGGPSNQEWSVFLDKGTNAGVAVGMSVVAENGLVGRVTDVGGTWSKVLLILDPTSSVGGRLTTTGDTGVVTGGGNAALSLGLLAVTETVATGAEVITSGYNGGVFPPGIPVGRVLHVNPTTDGLSLRASVQPYVDFNRLQLVLILLGTKPVPLPGT
ncbi:MAG TPA: rod shape-determining protein MreC [Actinomycetota bacterium]|nr:rod shape-determining protein MreC [Actinomycetota bacterium]